MSSQSYRSDRRRAFQLSRPSLSDGFFLGPLLRGEERSAEARMRATAEHAWPCSSDATTKEGR